MEEKAKEDIKKGCIGFIEAVVAIIIYAQVLKNVDNPYLYSFLLIAGGTAIYYFFALYLPFPDMWHRKKEFRR